MLGLGPSKIITYIIVGNITSTTLVKTSLYTLPSKVGHISDVMRTLKTVDPTVRSDCVVETVIADYRLYLRYNIYIYIIYIIPRYIAIP